MSLSVGLWGGSRALLVDHVEKQYETGKSINYFGFKPVLSLRNDKLANRNGSSDISKL